ncbi:hypothetical protein PS718_02614 [Pseudomonas fluorescens]|uniref:Uncharacterized protein n=1 Tax=Pseudomonas fluorescens TaxID=294 RepID=A0A5E7C8C4_PSEFL|nr:hypothetical protein [Pseudomonas fluorescens]VVO00421.1 hypothetical protein PS718_02614 [Pseudomonas fluorescens]
MTVDKGTTLPQDIAPVRIPGWVTGIQHPENPHGGIPLSLTSNGFLQLLIDPWVNHSAFDKAGVLLGASNVEVINKVTQPGEENQQFTMDLPAAYLKDGINLLRLRVTRVGQSPETSATLKVLFHTPRPGDQIPGVGDNPNLIMTLPADVIADGIDAERAARGVDVTLRYIHMRERDVITLYCDGREKVHVVTAAQAMAGSVLMTLVASDFWQDNPKFALRFRITDQLGNSSGPQAIWSRTTLIDVHIRKQPELDLPRPKVLEAKESGGTVLNFINDFYEAEFATVEVNYTGSDSGQTVRAQWLGRNFTYTTAVQTITSPGQTLRFQIPRLEVIDTVGSGHAEVTYTVRLPGTTEDKPSRGLGLTITPQKHLLREPTINADRSNLRVYYPTLEAPYKVRMALHGVVTRYGDELDIIAPSYTNISIPPAWITENRGKSVMFNYTLKRTGTTEPLIFSWCLRLNL